MTISQQIEAILFFKAEPVTFGELGRFLGIEASEAEAAVQELAGALSERGVRLIVSGETAGMYTAPEAAELLEKIHREEIERELSPAALETLSAVAYLGPVAKSEIDYIRGVNSAFILRALSVRGLIQKVPNPEDSRSFLYEPSQELLAHLGAEAQEQLPGYAETIDAIRKFKTATQAESTSPENAPRAAQ